MDCELRSAAASAAREMQRTLGSSAPPRTAAPRASPAPTMAPAPPPPPPSHDPTARERALREEVALLHTLLLAATPPPGVSIERLRALAVARAAGEEDALGADPRDLKLLDLARRNRALTLALSRAREQQARSAYEVEAPPPSIDPPVDGAPLLSAAADRARQLQRELAAATAAAAALTVQRDALAAELRSTRRVLSAEVDPALPMPALLAQCGVRSSEAAVAPGGAEEVGVGWRGRGQQILLLKARVRTLEQQQQQPTSGAGGARTQDERAAEAVTAMAAGRARRTQAVEAELIAARLEQQEARRCVDALKARVQVLDTAARSARASAVSAQARAESAESEVLELRQATEATVRRAARQEAAPPMRSSTSMAAAATAAAHTVALERLVDMLRRELASERAGSDELRARLG